MLKKIGLNNVRSFKDLKDLEIKPITVLCGTNSSGKSTILKSLLLWKQTLENLSYFDGFQLNGKYTNLGSQEDLLHNNTRSKVIKFNFQFEETTQNLELFNTILNSEARNVNFPGTAFSELVINTIPEGTFKSSDSIKIDFTLAYKINVKSEMGIDIKEYNLKIIPMENNDAKKSTEKGFIDDTHDSNNVELKISVINKDKIKVEWKNLLPLEKVNPNALANELSKKLQNLKEKNHILEKTGTGSYFSNILEFYVSSSSIEMQKDLGFFPDGMAEFVRITEYMKRVLTQYFSGISYLGPLREEPSRRYIFDDRVNDIGIKGENSAFLYNKYKEEITQWYNTFDPINEKVINNVGTLEEAVKNLLDEIGILDFGSVKNEELHRFSLRSSEFNEGRVNIADVGFGVSQVVPIVIAGLLEDSETLILEQPEIHLHPKMQMKLADFLLAMPLSGKNLIIETHSEHIINRFVRRIVEGESGLRNSSVGINFIRMTDKGSKIEKVKISEKNGIENWPDEFFDQTFGEQQKIMNAIIKNKQTK